VARKRDGFCQRINACSISFPEGHSPGCGSRHFLRTGPRRDRDELESCASPRRRRDCAPRDRVEASMLRIGRFRVY
jgi:hypothetical protein